MDVIPSEVHAYALLNTSQDDALLLEIQEHTELNHPEQHMLSGPLQGQFLNMVSRMIKPKRVLEIGTFVGYSAICLAKGLDKNGVLHIKSIDFIIQFGLSRKLGCLLVVGSPDSNLCT